MIRQTAISFRAMGSQFNVWLESDARGAAALQQVPAWVEEIEARLSRFRPDSELSRLNARSGKWVAVSELLFQAAAEARRAAQITGGLCNPLVLPALLAAGYTQTFADMPPDDSSRPQAWRPVPAWQGIELRPRQHMIRLPAGAQLDLGGTGKGWTAAQIAGRLAEFGPCLVDAGGDLVAHGHPHDQPGWMIQVAEPGPAAQQTALTAIQVHDAAVATSGIDFRRWTRGGSAQHHLIDPRTGQPAITDVVAATVIHPDAVLAEGYTKALLVSGSQAGFDWLLRQPQTAALIVRDDGAVLVTSTFQSYLTALIQ